MFDHTHIRSVRGHLHRRPARVCRGAVALAAAAWITGSLTGRPADPPIPQPVPFGPPITIGSANGAAAVYIADLNGDRRLDVLAASSADDTLRWYEHTGTSPPSFLPRVLTDEADGAITIVAGDLDGDLDLDIVASSTGDTMIRWFENIGGETTAFIERTVWAATSDATSIVLADLDHDMDLDIVVSAPEAGRVVWFENKQTNPLTFVAHIVTSTAGNVRSVFVGDIDGDGYHDVVAGSSLGSDMIVVHLSDGERPPGFTPILVTTNVLGLTSVTAADVNGDGYTDVLSASGFDNKIAWYENNGETPPGFTAREIATNALFARAVFAVDLDGDCDIDVLSASSTDDTVRWYENDGAALPDFTPHDITTAANGAASVFAADLDHDGDQDVIWAASVGDIVAWQENLTPVAPAPCPADVTCSGAVGVPDLLSILAAWGPCPGCPEDVTGDNIVGIADLIAVMQAWGACETTGACCFDGGGCNDVTPAGCATAGGTYQGDGTMCSDGPCGSAGDSASRRQATDEAATMPAEPPAETPAARADQE